MGWTSAGKTAAKYGVKYGPHAVALWKVAGHHVEAAARSKMDELTARRTAFDHADATAEGSVLRVVHAGQAVFVVFTADEPVAAYPQVEQDLDDLVATADLGKRVTPEQHHAQQLRARVRQARAKARRRTPPAVER